MFERYAIFFTPTGPLVDFGARWLGWDSLAGHAVPHLEIAGIDVASATQTPRKYGLHGTLKAPFYLNAKTDQAALQQAMAQFAAARASFDIGALELTSAGGFVALRPIGDQSILRDFAAGIVTGFDDYRAPLTPADIARRRKAKLSARQDRQMLDWGYPYVFEDFHFHLTLTGGLSDTAAGSVIDALGPHLLPLVPKPFVIDAITLMGQDSAGMFHQIHRYALTG